MVRVKGLGAGLIQEAGAPGRRSEQLGMEALTLTRWGGLQAAGGGRGSRGSPRGAAEWDMATLCPAGLRQQAPTLADHLEKRGVEAGQVHKGVRSVSVPAPGECGDLSLAGDGTEGVWA